MTQRNCRAKTKSCLKFSVVALSILVAGTALGNQVSAAEVHPTISTQESVLSTGVKEIASGLWNNFKSFVKEGLENSTSQNKYDFLSKVDSINTVEEVISIELNPTTFVDMEKDPNRYYVETLASKGIISNSTKFYPNNFIRLNEIAKMFVNSYRSKVGYNLDSNAGLTDKVYFDTIVPKYYNTAYEMGLLEGIENVEDFERFITYYDLKKILTNFKEQYPDLVNLYYMDIQESSNNLKRGETAKIVFKTMMIDSDIEYSFDDIIYNEYGDSIQLLKDLGIIDQAKLFKPDEAVTREDFIVRLVKAHLKVEEEHTHPIDFEIYPEFVDLNTGAESAPYIAYAQNEGWIEYISQRTRGKEYINPDCTLTKHEAYYIISKATGIKFNYDIIEADKQQITRGEVAELLVKSFKLKSNEKKISTINDSHIGRLIENIKGLANGGKKLAFVS